MYFVVVVMDFGSISVAISVRRDHNDDNIMKRRRRRSGENCDCRGGGTIKSTANPEQIEPRGRPGTSGRQDVTAIKPSNRAELLLE